MSKTYPITNKSEPYKLKINSNSSKLFSSSHCNNCGISGHTFGNCKFPITSIGIIAYRFNNDNNLEYLMICRKDTIGFIEFMRGKYSVINKLYIQNLISEMTIDEKRNILNNDFDTLWYCLWGDCVSNQFKSEEKTSREKFNLLKIGITNKDIFYNLQTLIEESQTCWLQAEWGFPKGRHNNLEKDLMCGLREFEEETGYPSHSVDIIQNLLPFEEIFTGSNYKSYKHKYYIGYIRLNQEPSKQYQQTEISKVKWASYDEAKNLIRPYNLEKIDVLKKVNDTLTKYKVYNN